MHSVRQFAFLFRLTRMTDEQYEQDASQAPAPGKSPAPTPPPAPRERATPEGDGLDPTRYGDWEKNGRCIDF
jgi:hypothetical protein